MHLQQKLSIFALFYNAGLFQSLEGKYYFMSKERNWLVLGTFCTFSQKIWQEGQDKTSNEIVH